MLWLQQKNTDIGKYIWKDPDAALPTQENLVMYAEMLLAAIVDKVRKAEKMDVRALVPGIWQGWRDGRSP